uniref:MTD1 n=2 Tax=Zea mays TaxID=4577 RepID=B6SUT2_MAIZE|nr:MTD1 [Zea mays]ACG43272.1 MTD1 [Zea mays]
MSTAVAEARPRYGFPGSGKGGSGGGHGKEADMAAVGKRRSDGFFIEEVAEEEVLTDTSSVGAPSPSGSSIGENSSSEAGGDDGDEEVESKLKEDDALDCLDALEDSLPVKKGLSSFYSGKSRSFTSLAEATSTVAAAAKELAKPENPFNKRRRILANWSRRASCSSLATAAYLPPLLGPDHAVAEGDEGEEDDSDSDDVECSQLPPPHRGKNVRDARALPPLRLGGAGMRRRNGPNGGLGSFRSPRSFSLSDLHSSAEGE